MCVINILLQWLLELLTFSKSFWIKKNTVDFRASQNENLWKIVVKQAFLSYRLPIRAHLITTTDFHASDIRLQISSLQK